MNDKLVRHIKNKLLEKDEISDHFDYPTYDVIKYIMLVTFNVVDDECQTCYFCQNYRRFSLGSMCRLKSHTRNNCYHFSMDIRKILKNKYYKIMIKVSECTRGMNLKYELCITSKTKKNIIYESIKLYEIMKSYNEIIK